MLTRIRRRLSSDDGVSLVEMLVALVIVTVALLGLLGALVASIRSVDEQRQRAAATRVATEHHERLRAGEYDAVTTATTTRTLDGRTYTLETVVDEVAAAPDGVVVPAGAPQVKRVRTTVTWRSATSERTAVYSTAIAPDDIHDGTPHGGGGRIETITMAPNPTVVDGGGRPTQPILVTVVLAGFDESAVVAVSWTNADGAPKAKHLVSSDHGITWTGELATASDVGGQVIVPSGATGLDLEVTAGSLSQLHTLTVSSHAAAGPAVSSVTLTPDPITVKLKKGACGHDERCNQAAVTASATVTGVDGAMDSVRLSYTLADGSPRETAMVYDPATSLWAVTFPAGSTQFKAGLQRFTVVAIAASSGWSGSAFVDRQVTVVS